MPRQLELFVGEQDHDSFDFSAFSQQVAAAANHYPLDNERPGATASWWAEVGGGQRSSAASDLPLYLARPPMPRRRYHHSGVGSQFGEEAGVGYPDGAPSYLSRYVELTPEQQALNTRWLLTIRAALEGHNSAKKAREVSR